MQSHGNEKPMSRVKKRHHKVSPKCLWWPIP